jgi:glycosyltransferase involved in cell wall biosynthesis
MKALKQRRRYLHSIALWIDIIGARLILQWSEALISVSNYTCNKLKEERGRKAPCFVLPQYRGDLESLRRTPRVWTHKPDAIKLLTVSNLNYREKYWGVLHLIEKICAYVFIKKNTISLTIAGGGMYEKQLREYIAKRLVPAGLMIDFVGFVTEPETLYKGSDIFVYCSELDGLPNVVLEAMAHGLPLILNDHEVYREFFVEERHCMYYNRDEHKGFCSALERLVEDTGLYSRLSVTNAEEFSKCFGLTALSGNGSIIIRALSLALKGFG